MKAFFKNNYIIIIAMISLIISRIPCVFFELHGINFDEAAINYNIFCISEFGTDRYLNPFPVYFANAASGQSALYVYIGVIFSKIFGFSVTVGRVIKLICEMVTLFFGGVLVRDIFNKRTEWIFYILYIISPYFYKMTGMAYDCDMVIPVFVLAMYLAYNCYKKNTVAGYIGLGVCLGMLSYSYIIAVFMIPLFIVVQLIFGWNRKYLIIETAVAFVVSFPIFLYLLTLIEVIPGIYTDYFTIAPVSMYRKSDFGFSIENLLNLKYMVVTDTQFDFSGSRYFGTIYYISWLLVPAGLIRLIKEIKTSQEKKCFIGFLIVAFVPLLLIKDASTYNFTVLYVFLLVLTAYGFDLLINNFKTFSVIVGIAYVVMTEIFLREYFIREPYMYGDDMIMGALEYVDLDEKVMLDTTGVNQPECYIGIKYGVNPKDIVYDKYGRGKSVGNIFFDDYENYKKYNTVLIRDKLNYEYYMGNGGGLSSYQVRHLIDEFNKLGYTLEIAEGYYFYSKGESENE